MLCRRLGRLGRLDTSRPPFKNSNRKFKFLTRRVRLHKAGRDRFAHPIIWSVLLAIDKLPVVSGRVQRRPIHMLMPGEPMCFCNDVCPAPMKESVAEGAAGCLGVLGLPDITQDGPKQHLTTPNNGRVPGRLLVLNGRRDTH